MKPETTEPDEYFLVGQDDSRLNIYLRYQLFKALEDFAKRESHREQVGLLVGPAESPRPAIPTAPWSDGFTLIWMVHSSRRRRRGSSISATFLKNPTCSTWSLLGPTTETSLCPSMDNSWRLKAFVSMERLRPVPARKRYLWEHVPE